MSVMSVKSVMSVRSHKSKYTPTYGVFYLSLRAFNRLCVSWYVHVIAFDLTAFIGQQESSQSLGCFCDTHLLRSVIKLFKLGRLDNHWSTFARLDHNSSRQSFWTRKSGTWMMNMKSAHSHTCKAGNNDDDCPAVRAKKCGTLHDFACHPCAGAMLIFSVSFQF